ncbi:g7048 [Coccomyxa elongata]
MHRQPVASCSYRDTAQLPETFPIVRSGGKISPTVGKRKERTANVELRVQVLQEQAKRPHLLKASQAPDGLQPNCRGFEAQENTDPSCRHQLNDSSPTDFSCLREIIGQDTSKSAAAPPNSFARRPPTLDHRSNVVTFDSIATRRVETQTDKSKYHSTIHEIIQTKSVLPSDDSKSRDAPMRQTSHAAQAAAPMQTFSGVTRPPIDWSLKSRALFLSQQPFSVCREAIMASSSSACETISCFARGAQPGPSNQERFQHALMTWQHPDTSLPAAAVSALTGLKSSQVLDARKSTWQEAFRSLFMALRSGACGAFYFATAEGAKRPFVAYFGGAGMGGRPHMHAWLSRSTHGVRERMRSEPCGLDFCTPLAPRAQAEAAVAKDERMQAELLEIGQRKAPTSAAGIDGKPASLVFFEGATRVHGLFEHLLFEAVTSSEQTDVPLLMSPVPFLGASLHQLHPQLLPSVERQTAPGAAGPGGYRMEVRGLLPPWVLDRLLAVLRDSQDGQFKANLETDPQTTAFNLAVALDTEGGRQQGTKAEGGILDQDEAERWQSPVGDMALCVMREVLCKNGLFTVRSERTLATSSPSKQL